MTGGPAAPITGGNAAANAALRGESVHDPPEPLAPPPSPERCSPPAALRADPRGRDRPVAGRARPAHRHRLLELHGRQRHRSTRASPRSTRISRSSPASPNPGPSRRTARPTPSSSAPASPSTTARRWRRRTSPRRSGACRRRRSPRRWRAASPPSRPRRRVDPRTVELKLKEPAAPLLASLATIAIVPRSMETNKDALQKAPVGTGPFRFQEWQPNGFILLARHDKYWQPGAPKLVGREVQHRAGIGDAAGRPRQRAVRHAAEHRRGRRRCSSRAGRASA